MDIPSSKQPWQEPDTSHPSSSGHVLRFAEIPAHPRQLHRIRHALSAWAAQIGMSGEQILDVALGTDEAMSNVVLHAYPVMPGIFDVHARYQPEDHHVTITVTDYGRWRPPAKAMNSDKLHMRGITLLNAVTTQTVITPTSRGTITRMRWAL
ncbi:ATP-binding protein [Amycolatopsis sp. NPDC059657]|uniref:ATP-binding protein n=1 Tax=Amycolatopsis sp. NPDC059657 TaxID=3346899 RepID=UPI00366EEA42